MRRLSLLASLCLLALLPTTSSLLRHPAYAAPPAALYRSRRTPLSRTPLIASRLLFLLLLQPVGPDHWLLQYPWVAYCGDLGPMSQDKCGKCLEVTNVATGASVKTRVVDLCGFDGVDMDPKGEWWPCLKGGSSTHVCCWLFSSSEGSSSKYAFAAA